MVQAPPTHFARSGDARIAYQVFGTGSVDLAVVGGPASHLDLLWEEPATARTLERMGTFARVVMFDRRGTGLSDPCENPPSLEQQMDDLRAVMDAVGLTRTALFGATDGGLCALYAATRPTEVTALVLAGIPSRGDYLSPERIEQMLGIIEDSWGEGAFLPLFAPSRVGDRRFEQWWGRFERSAVSPAMARKIIALSASTDLRPILPTISAPTLVMHKSHDALTPIALGREAAALIPGARFVEVPGTDPYGWLDPGGEIIDELEQFLTGRRAVHAPERVLATVLFTDIVDSTGHAVRLGDREWRDLLDRHNELVRAELQEWRGDEVKTVGDGFLATFDGPARAVRCAQAVVEGVRELGLEVRAGLHTGECELRDGDIGGIAVHIGARVGAQAGRGEVLVSSTVRDLVAGSGLRFADRGYHDLRGVDEAWRLFALEAA